MLSVCLCRTALRTLGGYGRMRTDQGEGCPEHIDFESLRFVARFPSESRPNLLRWRAAAPLGQNWITLVSAPAVRDLLRALPAPPGS